MTRDSARDAAVEQRLEREIDLIEGAMRLVASGAATRTVIAGLRLADAALAIADRRAEGLGVEVSAIRAAGDVGRDVIVQRRPDAGPR
jgi:hypothetical protein